MTGGDKDVFVPGITDLVSGNTITGLSCRFRKKLKGERLQGNLLPTSGRQGITTRLIWLMAFQACFATRNSMIIIQIFWLFFTSKTGGCHSECVCFILFISPDGIPWFFLYTGFQPCPLLPVYGQPS